MSNLYDLDRNRKLLFIEMLNELKQRTSYRRYDLYSLIRKSALLRLLLIDGDKFYQAINKEFKLKLEIRLNKENLLSFGLSNLDNSNSSFLIAHFVKSNHGEGYTLEQFLKLNVVHFNNPSLKEYLNQNNVAENYTVKDLIKLVANAHGGVHIEKWKNIPKELFIDSNSPFNINENSNLHRVIDNISEIVLAILENLNLTVINNIKSIEPIGYETTQSVIIK